MTRSLLITFYISILAAIGVHGLMENSRASGASVDALGFVMISLAALAFTSGISLLIFKKSSLSGIHFTFIILGLLPVSAFLAFVGYIFLFFKGPTGF